MSTTHPKQEDAGQRKEPQRLSRSKIGLFLDCPRCFYLDFSCGVKRPEFPAFTLNSAVDHLLKKEFDTHRAKGTRHPLLAHYGVPAVPFEHSDLPKWRHTFTGIQYRHQPTDFLIFGAIDDVWVNTKKELHIVDYKATAKNDDPDLDGHWQQAFKRQMEVYQWLFRKNGFNVSPIGYFVYVNGRRDREAFDGRLEFNVHLIPYEGSDAWIEPTLKKIRACVDGVVPTPSEGCTYCAYRKNAAAACYHDVNRPKETTKRVTLSAREKESQRLF